MDQPDARAPQATATPTHPFVVLGAGVAGLAAAYRLHQAGVPVRVFDPHDQVGGVVRSHREDGWLSEAGPNSFQENSRTIANLLAELGLEEEKVYAQPAAKKRYLVRNRKVQAVPSSPGAFLATPLFSPWAKLGLVREVFRSPRERAHDVSLAQFVGEHFGEEVVRYALNPFVSGVYAGDAAQLSAKLSFPSLWKAEATHGSLLRGLGAQAKEKRRRGEPRARILSFRSGLSALPQALARALPADAIRLGARVTRLVPGVHGAPWRIHVESAGGETIEWARAVISTVPAHALSQIEVGAQGLRPLAPLVDVVSPPVTSLFLGFRREDVRHPLDGFGVLIPAIEKSPILGVLFSSSLFANRAPAGHVALTVMIGGCLRPELTQLDEPALLARVLPELGHLLGVHGQPVFVRRQSWARAIPQYNLGYERFLTEMETCEHTYPRLFLGGQVRDGISLAQCLQAGLDLAERALR